MDTKTTTAATDAAGGIVRPRGRRARRAIRALAATLLATMALLGLGSGTAQAMPWDDAAADISAFVSNICGPLDVPAPSTHRGFDTLIGLNAAQSDQRGTVIPSEVALAASPGDMRINLADAYGSDPRVANPSYQRYGFATLQWDTYGGGCMNPGRYASPMLNGLFTAFVAAPTAATMWLAKATEAPWLSDLWSLLFTPLIGVLTKLLSPWIFVVAGVGALYSFVKHRGSLTKMIAHGAWIFGIVGMFLWLGISGPAEGPGYIHRQASNLVTTFGSAAADAVVATGTGSCATIPDDAPAFTALNESIWYGVAYQSWAAGEVGVDQAATDGHACGSVGLADAILNGHYVGDDSGRAQVLAGIRAWNAGSYSPQANEGEDASVPSKVYQWTRSQKSDASPTIDGPAHRNVPYLAAVRAMCGGDYGYGGTCDTAPTGTESAAAAMSGANFSERAVMVFAGGLAAICLLATVGVVAGYLIVQKFNFWWLLIFGPAFLTIAVFGDDKRRQFATKYAEALAANIAKQCVAVFSLLLMAQVITLAMSPAIGVPALVRPAIILFMFVGMLMLAKPAARIMTAGVKGDSDIVRRTAEKATVGHATKKAATTAVKAGVAAGAFAATGGASALATAGAAAKAGGVASAAKGLIANPAALRGAAKMLGTRSGAGRALMTGVRASEAMRRATAGMPVPPKGEGLLGVAGAAAGAAMGARVNGATPVSPAPVSAVGTDTAATPNGAVAAAQARAASVGDGPRWTGLPAGVDGALTSAEQVLAGHGMTRAEAVRAPETLVPTLYGGKVVAMSPLHPATPALTRMTMAGAAGDRDAFAAAHGEAQALIEAHGVPETVTAPLHGVGETAAAYRPQHVAAVAATVTPEMTHEERAEAVVTMGRLVAGMPADAPERAEVEAFVHTLGDVSASTETILAARDTALTALPEASVDSPAAQPTSHTEHPVMRTVEAPRVEAVEAPRAERVEESPAIPAHVHTHTHVGTGIPAAPVEAEPMYREPVSVPQAGPVVTHVGTDTPAPTPREAVALATSTPRPPAEGTDIPVVQASDEPDEIVAYRHKARRRATSIYGDGEPTADEGTVESSPPAISERSE